ncbi:MAG: replication initiation factor domain-containing protein [Anaerolineales bacterium]
MFSVHWFSITIHQDFDYVKNLWSQFFALGLGVLVDMGHGGRGYKQIYQALLGSKVYFEHNNAKEGKEHCHIEIPGSACEAVLPSVFPELVKFLTENNVRFAIKRADFAFDGVPFSPQDFLDGLMSENLVSLIKRDPALNNDSVRVSQSPCALRENGEVGTMTVYAGSASSQRMVRVYNKRGDTRLELQLRDERAHAVCLDVFAHAWEDWEFTVKTHLRQFIDFKNTDWWAVFVSIAHRADLKISSARRMSLTRMEEWFNRQVVVSLSVYEDVWGKAEAKQRIDKLINKARKTRDRSRYASVLQLASA